MPLFLSSLAALPLISGSINSALIAKEINCDSAVWRSGHICLGKQSNKKSIQYGRWFPFGFDKNGNPVNFVQLLSYKKLNKNSFRLKSKFTDIDNQQLEGKLDINCENKDYYIRPENVKIVSESEHSFIVDKCFFQGKNYRLAGNFNGSIW